MGKSKKFPPITEIGDSYKEISFFKKQVSIRRDVSSLSRNLLFQRIKSYNNFYGTNFYVTYIQVGTADLYKLEKIEGGINSSITSKIKRLRKKITDFIEIDGQYSLFPI